MSKIFENLLALQKFAIAIARNEIEEETPDRLNPDDDIFDQSDLEGDREIPASEINKENERQGL